MISLEQFMKTVDYRITEGSTYDWRCYGDNAYSLSAWNGVHGAGGWSANITFDTKDQTVYEVDMCDYTNDRAYRVINPEFADAFGKESETRAVPLNQAWDEVDYMDLEVDEDWLEKAQAIVSGEIYDTRVQVPLDFSDEELLKYMKLAHEQDVTFNQLVTQALTEAIAQHKTFMSLKAT
jgi:hypothetical protein